MSIQEVLSHNLTAIFAEMHSACMKVGRDPSSAKLVAVTKYAAWPWVEELCRFHQTFGENRPQQLAERHSLMPASEWHLIGQLQRNKVRMVLPHAALIHSVDSLKLLEKIVETAGSLSVQPKLLLQLNLSQEVSKSGFALQELQAVWPTVLTFADQVEIKGLMTMAAESENPEDARPVFRSLRELRDLLAAREDSQTAGVSLPELSMGMSGDFVPAVEEGATLVRIGSRIFEGLSL